MSRREKKEKKNNISKKKIIIISIAVVVAIILSILLIFFLNKEEKQVELADIEPTIYYNFYNDIKYVLTDNEENVFGLKTTINWKDGCKGTIKKDGNIISKENGTTLEESGKYEITVIAPNKEKNVKSLEIDKIPPEVKLEKGEANTYTLVFADINDIGKALLIKYNDDDEILEEKDLLKEGLNEKIEIKEKGNYIFECTDKLGNAIHPEIEFEIK